MINIDVPLNFNAITNRLLVGSRPQTLSDIERLRMASVSHIIDVCEVDDALLLNGADWISMGIEGYLWNTAFDNGLPKPASWFPNVPALCDASNGRFRSSNLRSLLRWDRPWTVYRLCYSQGYGVDSSTG